jgi:hypothetical protein
MSSRNGGSGVIIASTIPSTAMGTANSRQLGFKPAVAGAAAFNAAA